MVLWYSCCGVCDIGGVHVEMLNQPVVFLVFIIWDCNTDCTHFVGFIMGYECLKFRATGEKLM